MAGAGRRLVDMWDVEPVGMDARRPLWGFAAVTLLCAVLMVAEAGQSHVVLGLFHPATPIVAAVPDPVAPARPAAASGPGVVSLPPELIVQPVGRSTAQATMTRSATSRSAKPERKRRHGPAMSLTPRWERARR